PTDLGQLIQQIFIWSLGLLGIAVFVMFFYAGFLWLTAAGNTAKVSEAKRRMTNAVFGAILLLSSYLILNTINPDFVKSTFNLRGLGTN
ncbi:pilin, partial [Loigolactobacillus coryniformis]|uniref:pilin n=1 Tax=Loigolactobacillus coryniformis TaxID=1610 RepID=UPI00201AC057